MNFDNEQKANSAGVAGLSDNISVGNDNHSPPAYHPSSFVNPDSVTAFLCTGCSLVPHTPWTNAEGDIFCSGCKSISDYSEARESRLLKKMIGNLEIKCLNNKNTFDDDDEEGQSNHNHNTSAAVNHHSHPSCNWTGPLKSWSSHANSGDCTVQLHQCPFAVKFGSKCHPHRFQSRDLSVHLQVESGLHLQSVVEHFVKEIKRVRQKVEGMEREMEVIKKEKIEMGGRKSPFLMFHVHI